MNCILYIKTSKDIDIFSRDLQNDLGNANSTGHIFSNTSLSTTNFLPLYFYGNTNQTMNYLYAKDNSDRLRIFIESVSRRDNLDQLVNGVRDHFNNIKSFFDKHDIKTSEVSATIWSEDEEILKGEYQGYWKRFRSNIIDLPTGIYLSALTVIYSFFQVDTKETDNKVENGLKLAGINLLIVAISIFLWLLVKASGKKESLSFKIK